MRCMLHNPPSWPVRDPRNSDSYFVEFYDASMFKQQDNVCNQKTSATVITVMPHMRVTKIRMQHCVEQ